MAFSTSAAVVSSSSLNGVATSPAGVAGFLLHLKIENPSDSMVLKTAIIIAVFIAGGFSIVYNGTAVYKAFALLEVFQGLFRIYMIVFTVLLMAVEINSTKATIIWQVLIETRIGRGMMHLLLAITLRELPDLLGGMQVLANSILMLAGFFILAGLLLPCIGSIHPAEIEPLRNDAVSDAEEPLVIGA